MKTLRQEAAFGSRSRRVWWLVLVAAMTGPTLASLAYFVWLEGTAWVAPVYAVAKVLQFAGPVAALGFLLAAATGPSRRVRSVVLGLSTGLAGAALTWFSYVILFRGGAMAATAAEAITVKLSDFHLDALWRYVIAALLISFLHSWLEEVYWRAFVYRWLRSLMNPCGPRSRHTRTSPGASHRAPGWHSESSLVVAALGFAAHHVVVIHVYLDDPPVLILFLMSLPVVLGGVLWSTLYRTTGNRLLAPWISHICLDLAIMAVGYDLVFVDR